MKIRFLVPGALQACCLVATLYTQPWWLVHVFTATTLALLVFHWHLARPISEDVPGRKGQLLRAGAALLLTAIWGAVDVVLLYGIGERLGWH